MAKLFTNSIEGLTTEKDFDIYFAPKNGQRANEINIGRASKRLKKELNIVQDMISILVNRPIRTFDLDTVYQYGELVQLTDMIGDSEYVQYWQSQLDNNIAINPLWSQNVNGTYWKEFEPFGNYSVGELSGDYKNDVKFGHKMHNSGYFIIGERLGHNIAIDRDEISARFYDSGTKNTLPGLLRLQADGGLISIHGNLWEIPSERFRVSVFTDDGRLILGNNETIHTATTPHQFDKCYKFECWGDALITQEARFGGWVTFDRGFSKVPSITVQDGTGASLSDRLVIAPSASTGKIEVNALQPVLDKGSTLYLQNNINNTGDIIINSNASIVHITNDGRIGIKRLAPRYALDVKGTIVSDDSNNSAMIVANNTSSLVINTCTNRKFYINAYADTAPESLHIQNAGGDTYFNCINNIIHLTSTGRIGIGVENPTCALDVRGNAIFSGGTTTTSLNIANATKKFRIESRAGDNDFRILTAADDGSNTTLYIQDNDFSDTVFNGNDSACIAARKTVHISREGNVGIGAYNTTFKLSVMGKSYFDDVVQINSPGGSTVTALETNGRIKAVYFDGPSASANFATTAGALGAPGSDLAERYESDKTYEPGTVLGIGGFKEVTLFNENTPLAGIVSTLPGAILNDGDKSENMILVALKGRVPCKINGNAKKGQYIVADNDGKGKAIEKMTFEDSLLLLGVALSDSIDGWVEVKI